MRQYLESPSLLWGMILIIGLALLAGLANYVRRQREHAWHRLARKLHLTFRNGATGPIVTGNLNGMRVELCESTDSSDTGGGVILAQVSVAISGLPSDMSVQSAAGLIGDLTNLEEHVLLGDETFDRNVHLQGTNQEQLRQYWTTERRATFLKLVQDSPEDHLLLTEGLLIAERRGLHHDVETLKHWLRSLTAAASALNALPHRSETGSNQHGHH